MAKKSNEKTLTILSTVKKTGEINDRTIPIINSTVIMPILFFNIDSITLFLNLLFSILIYPSCSIFHNVFLCKILL